MTVAATAWCCGACRTGPAVRCGDRWVSIHLARRRSGGLLPLLGLEPIRQEVARFQDVLLGDRASRERLTCFERIEQFVVFVQRMPLVFGEHPQEVRRHHPGGLFDLSEQPGGVGGPVDRLMKLPVRLTDGIIARAGGDRGSQLP